MTDEWQVSEGTGWIDIPGFGRIDPRRDNVGGGREWFTAMVDDGTFADVAGEKVSHGPETWLYELDQPFYLWDRGGRCLEVTISLLPGGRYAVKYRNGEWPAQTGGAW
ncbi:hypothetical protein [Nocardioides zeae]